MSSWTVATQKMKKPPAVPMPARQSAQQPWFSQPQPDTQPPRAAQPGLATAAPASIRGPQASHFTPSPCTASQQQGINISITWGPVGRCTCSTCSPAMGGVETSFKDQGLVPAREEAPERAPRNQAPARSGSRSLAAATSPPWKAAFDRVRSGTPTAKPQRRATSARPQMGLGASPVLRAFL